MDQPKKLGNQSSYFGNIDISIRPLLDANDKLRDLLENEDSITLPKIAVIGGQSAGKSSILERLCGCNLPRGEGTVTRCALVLQMQFVESMKIPKAYIKSSRDTEYREISHENISAEIINLTNELDPDEHISTTDSISLRIESNKVRDLTVVDLPGN